jgi:ferritin-like metal-binding protein YciE
MSDPQPQHSIGSGEVTQFLSDMYSVEQQALAQLVSAPNVAGDPAIAEHFRVHYDETKHQAERVEHRMEALGADTSELKDAVMKLGGKGFLLFARVQPETPGRLLAHAYSYEAMEWAGYEMLRRLAESVNDTETAHIAESIAGEERTMMDRLEEDFDAAEAVSHQGELEKELDKQLQKHLAEAHALENQSLKLLDKGQAIGGDPALEKVYAHLRELSAEHQTQLQSRLSAQDTSPSTLKDTALAMAGLNWGWFFQAQSDTPAKLVAFVYAFLHLQIAGYELLQRSARRAGDGKVEQLCQSILGVKRAAADELVGAFDSACRVTLETLASAR